MDRNFLGGLALVLGVALLAAALAMHGILLEARTSTWVIGIVGAVSTAIGIGVLRRDLRALLRARRGEIALFTLGLVGVLVMVGWLTARHGLRFDLTEAGRHSLSTQTAEMLRRLERPVHIVFFHDRLMAETVDLYRLMAAQTPKVTVELHDPTLNPARARMLGVQFAGTSVMESEGRTLMVHGATETDIANGILRVTQGAKQRVCFLDGHGEADPFSIETHDHVEGSAGPGHSHGLGAQYVLHERHGLAKARQALETVNYETAKIKLVSGADTLSECLVLVVAGPKTALLPAEVTAVRDWLAGGGNALMMLDPFVVTGLEPVLLDYGVILDEAIVIDVASHYWSDVSAPAVTEYGRHQITRELPLTFFPGARSLSPTAARVLGTRVWPLVNTSRNSYGEVDPRQAEFQDGVDLPGPRTLMVAGTRRPPDDRDALSQDLAKTSGTGAGPRVIEPTTPATAPSRIVVVGDSDFATNSFFHFLGNGNLFLNAVNYLAAQEDLIGIEPRTHDLPRLSITNRQMKATFVLAVMALPALLAVIGTLVWWRQR